MNNQKLTQLLDFVIKNSASDLHLCVDYPPLARVDNQLIPIPKEKILTRTTTAELIDGLLNRQQKECLRDIRDVDFSYSAKDESRFRVNVYYEKENLAAALRYIPAEVPSLSELHLPAVLNDIIQARQGLFLTVGPAGQGKTTTLAAIVNEINHNRREHIISIEDPIEYIFEPKESVINQREVGQDAKSFPQALRAALRQDPNIIFVGEMRDLETISTAITLAETGHLVVSTLHTNDASQTIDRIIDVFPSHQQEQVKSQLAATLIGIFSQRLIPAIDGGRIVAYEFLKNTSPVKNLIREGKIHQINNVIQTGAEEGMITLETSLVNLYLAQKISKENAITYAIDPKQIQALLK